MEYFLSEGKLWIPATIRIWAYWKLDEAYCQSLEEGMVVQKTQVY